MILQHFMDCKNMCDIFYGWRKTKLFFNNVFYFIHMTVSVTEQVVPVNFGKK